LLTSEIDLLKVYIDQLEKLRPNLALTCNPKHDDGLLKMAPMVMGKSTESETAIGG